MFYKSIAKTFLPVAAAVFMLAQPASAAAPKGYADPSKEVILKINGKNFTRENLDTAVANMMPSVAFHSSVSPRKLQKIKTTAVNSMINNELIYKDAKARGAISVSSKEIDQEIENLKKSLPPNQTLDQVLKRSKMTMTELTDYFKEKIAIKHATKAKTEEIKKTAEARVTEAFMRDYYQNNLGKFKEPEQIHLSSILIKADPSGGQKVWNEMLKKAKNVAKMAREGQDFAELAKKYSEDPNAQKGGDMGWSHMGSLFEEIDAAAAKMKVGEISEPVMTLYGYHILKLEAKKPSVQRKFEDLNKESLKSDLIAKQRTKLWTEWIEGLRAKAKIEYIAEDIKPKKEEEQE